MKFLCGNCKAKYQIADEKIAGRTLRMKCRRCSHDIIIKGQHLASPGAKAGAAPRKPAPPPARPPSALGADFRRQASAPPRAPEPPPAADQWHVAINDVPVGPIRVEEVARKIQTGAVTGDSLCWREGFDDWRPVREVAELSALLRQPTPAPSPRQPVGRGIGNRSGSRPRIRPVPPRAPAPATPLPRPDASRPAARSNVVPIGGRLGASAAPAVADDFDAEETRVSDPLFASPESAESASIPDGPGVLPPSSSLSSIPRPAAPEPRTAASVSQSDSDIPGLPPAISADDDLGFAAMSGAAPAAAMTPSPYADAPFSDVPPKKKGLPVGAWIGIAGACAFGITLALVFATKILFAPEPVADATPVQTTEPEVPEPDLVLDNDELEPEEEEIVEPEEEEAAETQEEGDRPSRPRNRTGPAMSTTTMSRELTAEQRALIERMQGSSGSQPANIAVDPERNMSSSSRGGTGLTAQQLSSVVNRNKRSLQRCYENAIRGMGNPPSVRLDVTVTVSATGGVSRVSVGGNDIGGLKSCVESGVRRWRFPSSGASTQTSFPVVFQPGS